MPRPRRSTSTRAALALVLASAALASGCGAMTLRLAAAPTLDTIGRPGFEATFAFGTGLPLDLHRRSQHYFQGHAALGAGVESAGRPILVARGDLAYIYWNAKRLDVRAGMGVTWRGTPGEGNGTVGVGGHFGVMPAVWQWAEQIAVTQLCVGPELRAEALIRTDGGEPAITRGLLSVPLVVEANILIAGD